MTFLRGQMKIELGVGEMTQSLRILAAVPECWSSVPSTHIRRLTTACNSKVSGALLWLQQTPALLCTQPPQERSVPPAESHAASVSALVSCPLSFVNPWSLLLGLDLELSVSFLTPTLLLHRLTWTPLRIRHLSRSLLVTYFKTWRTISTKF